MAFGLGELRLAPDAFWAMTPRELALAAARLFEPRIAPPTRDRLRGLMTRFPDEERHDG